MNDRRAPDWLTRWEYAHRGLHREGVPENSLAAGEGAIAAGMGIECDIQMSRDDHPMVFHDWALARLTGVAARTAMYTAAAIEALGLCGTDQHPMRLAKFLASVAGRVPVLIEIKSLPDYDVAPSCHGVAAVLADYGGESAVMSFDPGVGAWFAAYAPSTLRGLVGHDSYVDGFEGVWRDPASLAQAQPDFLAIDVRDLLRPEAGAWRAAGRPLLTWTVRSPQTRVTGLAHADALIAEGDGLA